VPGFGSNLPSHFDLQAQKLREFEFFAVRTCLTGSQSVASSPAHLFVVCFRIAPRFESASGSQH
jgi:hypothetical protein